MHKPQASLKMQRLVFLPTPRRTHFVSSVLGALEQSTSAQVWFTVDASCATLLRTGTLGRCCRAQRIALNRNARRIRCEPGVTGSVVTCAVPQISGNYLKCCKTGFTVSAVVTFFHPMGNSSKAEMKRDLNSATLLGDRKKNRGKTTKHILCNLHTIEVLSSCIFFLDLDAFEPHSLWRTSLNDEACALELSALFQLAECESGDWMHSFV